MPMFHFRHAPQQEVALPDGRRWTVRVERDTEPHWSGSVLALNGWYYRWLASRFRFYARPRTRRHWHVVVIPEAVVSSQQLALAQTSLLITPAMGKPVFVWDFSKRFEAEQWAARVYDQLARSGHVPGAAEES